MAPKSTSVLRHAFAVLLIVYAAHATLENGIDVTCTSSTMTIRVNATLFPHVNFTLNDPSCQMTLDDTGTLGEYTTSFNECGTTLTQEADHLVFKNNLTITLGETGPVITRQIDHIIAVSCSLERNVNSSSTGFINVTSPAVQVTRNVLGIFAVEIQLYQEDTFTTAYTTGDYPIQLELQDRVNTEVSVNTNNVNVKLVVQKCYTTPTADPNSVESYVILEDRCPKDATFTQVSSQTNKYQFNFEAFEFLDVNTTSIYIHCQSLLCTASSSNPKCTFGCPTKRRRRAITDEEETDQDPNISDLVIVSTGRLYLVTEKDKKDKSNDKAWYKETSTVIVIAFAIILMALVFILALFVRFYMKSKQQKTTEVIGFENVSYN